MTRLVGSVCRAQTVWKVGRIIYETQAAAEDVGGNNVQIKYSLLSFSFLVSRNTAMLHNSVT